MFDELSVLIIAREAVIASACSSNCGRSEFRTASAAAVAAPGGTLRRTAAQNPGGAHLR
jgi:hypothetical protein